MAAPRGFAQRLRGTFYILIYSYYIIIRGIQPPLYREGIRPLRSSGVINPAILFFDFRVGLIHTAFTVAGDVADGGASIERSAGNPRVDRVDADHRSSDRARVLINRVITVGSSATWRHHTRRSRGARTTDRDQRHARFKDGL